MFIKITSNLFSRTIFISFVLTLMTMQAQAQDLYFAGFAFVGNKAQAQTRYPVASELFKQDAVALNKPLNEALKKLKRSDISIIKGESGSLKSGNAVGLSFGLVNERIERLVEQNEYQSYYRVIAEILVFDFAAGEGRVIANYPVAVEYHVESKELPTAADDKKAFQAIYQDLGTEKSIFNAWVNKLEQVKIVRGKNTIRLKIRNIDLDPAVVNQLPEELKANNTFATETAQRLEVALVTNQQVPVLPYTGGEAIGNAMLIRFADTDFQLRLPEPDFVIDVLVREFKRVTVEQKNVYDAYIYGAFVTLKVLEPLGSDVKFESKFNYKNQIQIPKSYNLKVLSDWSIYARYQDALFNAITKQISERNDKALADITNTPNIKDQLKSFENIINQCK